MVRLELKKMSGIGNGVFLLGTNIIDNLVVKQHPEDPNLYCSYRDLNQVYKKVYCHYLLGSGDSPVIYHDVVVAKTLEDCLSKLKKFKIQALKAFAKL